LEIKKKHDVYFTPLSSKREKAWQRLPGFFDGLFRLKVGVFFHRIENRDNRGRD
jgi:hypothetical protein